MRRLPAWQLATMGLAAAEGVAGLWLAVRLDVPPGRRDRGARGRRLRAGRGGRRPGRGGRRAWPSLAGAAVRRLRRRRHADAPSVVATTTVIADWARAVGGDRATVHQLLRPNTDPHEYEPRPSDVERTADAKVVLENGDGLDRWMGDVVRQADGHGTVVDLSRGLPVRLPGESSGAEASRYDPHWWDDPANARHAVLAIRDALSAANPAAAATYRANADAYLRRLDATDRAIAACLDRVPAGAAHARLRPRCLPATSPGATASTWSAP